MWGPELRGRGVGQGLWGWPLLLPSDAPSPLALPPRGAKRGYTPRSGRWGPSGPGHGCPDSVFAANPTVALAPPKHSAAEGAFSWLRHRLRVSEPSPPREGSDCPSHTPTPSPPPPPSRLLRAASPATPFLPHPDSTSGSWRSPHKGQGSGMKREPQYVSRWGAQGRPGSPWPPHTPSLPAPPPNNPS